jgi:hypothetical protein
MARPKGSYNLQQAKFVDYLETIANTNSRNKARHILAKLYGDNGNGSVSVTRIRLFLLDLSNSDVTQSTIRAYLLECLKYFTWLSNENYLKALYYYANAYSIDYFESPLWDSRRPVSVTLPSD